jgi:transcriptional regulator with XRE-family HTH domain
VNAEPPSDRLLKHTISRPATPKRQLAHLQQLAREGFVGQRLSQVASLEDLNTAWHQYELTVREVKAADLEMLRPIEVAIEEDDHAALEQLPARIHPLSAALRSDLQDTWARLRARQLIERLKEAGSLRALAAKIHVSAPYLSQLSDGAGPVPSASILKRLEAGIVITDQEMPAAQAPPPDEALEVLLQRIHRAAEQLATVSRQRSRPMVSVEYPDARKRKHLEDCLRAVADRFVDPNDGELVQELITAIVFADQPNLTQWARLTRDDSWKDLAALIAALGGDQRDAVISLVKTMAPPEPLPQLNVIKKSTEPK